MKEIEPQPAKGAPVDGGFQLDIETIIEQIWDDLDGSASRSDIRKALMEVAPAYEGVRVKTYVPIFLRRDVTQRLLGRLTLYQRAEAPEPRVDA